MTDDLFQGGLLEAPLYSLKSGVSRGPPGLSGGQAPSGPPVIRPLLLPLPGSVGHRQSIFTGRVGVTV